MCEEIENFLNKVSKDEKLEIEYDSYYDGSEIKKILDSEYFDCIFLDIEVGSISGIDISKYLRETLKNETTEIIYVSQHRQYAVDLFDYDPITFLTKPIEPTKLNAAFYKFLNRLKINNEVFTYKIGQSYHRIPYKDILYFEVRDHQIAIHCLNNIYEYYDKIERIAEILENRKFLMIHRSFLVNSKHIQKYQYEKITLDNGEILNIAQSKRSRIREWHLQNASEEWGWFL